MDRSVTPRLRHFKTGDMVRLAVDGWQYKDGRLKCSNKNEPVCTVGERKDDRYVWLSETSFVGLDCVVILRDSEYRDWWLNYIKRF